MYIIYVYFWQIKWYPRNWIYSKYASHNLHILVHKLVQKYSSNAHVIIVTSRRAFNDILFGNVIVFHVVTFYKFLRSSTVSYVLLYGRIFMAFKTTHRLLYTLSKHNFLSVSRIFTKNVWSKAKHLTFLSLYIISVFEFLYTIMYFPWTEKTAMKFFW